MPTRRSSTSSPASCATRPGRIYPVGRLDRDSEGLLLLTNDGDWAQRVLHPSYGVEREYAAGVREPLGRRPGAGAHHGVTLEEGVARVVSIRRQTDIETRRLLTALGDRAHAAARLTWYRVILTQGWKRQIRRMFLEVGALVERLVRVRIGTVRLGELAAGRGARADGTGARPAGRPTAAADVQAGRPATRRPFGAPLGGRSW